MSERGAERAIFRLEQRLQANWVNFRACEETTQHVLEKLNGALVDLAPPDTSIVAFGSLARRELTVDSDADWSLLVDGPADPQHSNSIPEIARGFELAGLKAPGREATFGQPIFGHDLVYYIGGEDDTNRNMTRRLLLLLESLPLGRREVYDRVVRNVLDRYLSEDYGWIHGRNPEGVPRFLQNDISRYWRTLGVDFAYKQRQRGGEGWGLRSTKLRLSRKLIFASGLLYCFSCALDPEICSLEVTAPSRTQATIEHLWQLCHRPPADALAEAFLRYPSLNQAAADVFNSYDQFLGLLSDPERRQHLETLALAAVATDETYELVRSLGKTFQRGLDQLFMEPTGADVFKLTKVYGVF
jgi:hypothetical protein